MMIVHGRFVRSENEDRDAKNEERTCSKDEARESFLCVSAISITGPRRQSEGKEDFRLWTSCQLTGIALTN